MRTPCTALLCLVGWVSVTGVAAASTVQGVRADGQLTCGINRAATDFSKSDVHGNLAALDADVCKAVAVAVLGPTAKIILKVSPDEPRSLQALQRGAVVLVAGATPNAGNRALYGIGFGPTIFHDGQGFLVNDVSGVRSLHDFQNKQICYIANTQADARLIKAFRDRGIEYLPFPFEEQGEMEAALFTGHCAAITADLSQLADTRYGFRTGSSRFHIAPDVIAEDPFAPAYRLGDSQWAAIVERTMSLIMTAERQGVTSLNVASLAAADPKQLNHRLGIKAASNASLSLDDRWAVQVIQAVGNYGEIYDRDVGKDSALRLSRR